MDRTSCSRCHRPAEFSLAFLVSTIGARPRGQKCTQTVPLRKSCLSTAVPFLAAYSPPRPRTASPRRVYSVERGFSGIVRKRWPLPIGGRGPPGRRSRLELQALSNSLQLT
jgi:hypothetical protein